MIEFYLPSSQPEWLAFAAAVATILFGLWQAIALLFTHFPTSLVARAQAAGLQIGFGVIAVLMAQPLIYLALGAGWGVSVLVQIVAMARHGRAGGGSLVALVLALVLAVLPTGYALGLF
ncbi:DUF4345 domain-containing protein [Pararhizobium haloflavum]|uniref:DUF4345 domain-containing protein n=1 Tax=Pararhizobium haloflavum TaxID=2037914 RepID=UPI000C1A775F|nr:DUF4345 domain-containing protein [Pararhizobium haloflavum]